MKKIHIVLSLFDGMSCGQVVLNRAGVQFNTYYASEIDPKAILATQFNHPNTIQVGDIRHLDPKDFKHVTILLAGFPCTDFSIMGRRRGMVTKENIKVTSLEQYLELKNSGFEFVGQSYLFWEMIRMIKGINPEYYILENVAKISPEWFEIIVNELGYPYLINADVLTTQNRERFFWTNIPQFDYPEPKGLTLDTIIPGVLPAGKRGVPTTKKPNGKFNYVQKLTIKHNGKANCLVTSSGATNLYVKDGDVFTLSPEECEVIQTLESGYTNVKGISKSARYKLIGNGWSVDAVVPLVKALTI